MEKFPWWTDAHVKLAEDVDNFVDEIMPRAQALAFKREYPWELVKAIAKKGWFGAIIPEEYGGRQKEMGYTGCCIVHEGLSRGPHLQYPYLLTHCGGIEQILGFAKGERRKEWLTKFAKGELLGTVLLTEPYVGSDAAGVESTAVKDGDDYIVNGKKRFQTNSVAAQINILYAVTSTDPADVKKYRHLSAFVLEKGMPGFTVEKVNELIGFDNIYNSYLDIEDVRIPSTNLLGEEGDGWKIMMAGLNFERTISAAGMLGSMQEGLRYALFHTERRVQFGAPTIKIATNQFKLAETLFTYKTARLLTYYTAYMLDLHQQPAAEAAGAKMFTTDHPYGMKLYNDVIQCMGGDGVTKFYPVEFGLRDSKIMQIAAGSNEIMRVILFSQGLRAIRDHLKPPIREIDPDLNIPVTVGFGEAKNKRSIKSEDDLLGLLADNYRVNPALHMMLADIKAVADVDDDELVTFLDALEKNGLASLFRSRKGDIQMARPTYAGLRKAKPKEAYRYIPDWVIKEDLF
jgi:alkylation response protein AidB-like acyl-CoA dehydrogenase